MKKTTTKNKRLLRDYSNKQSDKHKQIKHPLKTTTMYRNII